MTKETYIKFLHDPQADMIKAHYFYFRLKGKGFSSLSLEAFRHRFSMWLLQTGIIHSMLDIERLQYYVLKELNDYFYV